MPTFQNENQKEVMMNPSGLFQNLWQAIRPDAKRVAFLYEKRWDNYGSTEQVKSPSENPALGHFVGISFRWKGDDYLLDSSGKIHSDITRAAIKHAEARL